MSRIFSAATDSETTTSGVTFPTTGFTIFAMALPDFGQSGYIVYIGHGSDSGAGYGFNIAATGEVHADIAFVANVNSGIWARFGQWNRIVLTRRAADSKWLFFVNGVKSTANVTNNSFNPDGRYTIGSVVNSTGVTSSPFKGKIAEVAFWNIELTDKQIYDLTTGKVLPKDVNLSGLLEYHPLKNFQQGSTEYFDFSSGTGLNLPRSGTSPFLHPSIKSINLSKYVNSLTNIQLANNSWKSLLGVGQ